jgi:hypothetical protein
VQRRLFALDHNFPQPILAALAGALPHAELVPVRDIDRTYADLADWELLRELHRHARGWDGLVTNDDTMLSLAKEMTVLDQTVLLCHLAHICHHTTPGTGQIWRLRVAQKNAEPVRDYLDAIANKSKTTAARLVADNKLPAADLRRR